MSLLWTIYLFIGLGHLLTILLYPNECTRIYSAAVAKLLNSRDVQEKISEVEPQLDVPREFKTICLQALWVCPVIILFWPVLTLVLFAARIKK